MTRSDRYVELLRRRWLSLLTITALAFAGSLWLVAFHLPLRADFANLLPADAPAVRDLHRLEQRVSARDKLLVLVVADRPDDRARAARALAARLRTLSPALVERVEDDDAIMRAFLGAHRQLYVPLADLEAARDALTTRVHHARLAANPLYVDLDEPSPEDIAASTKRLDELRRRQRDAEAKLARSSLVSADGRTQLLVISTAFPRTDVDSCGALVAALEHERTAFAGDHPAVVIGFAGGPVVTLAEHSALVRGMVMSSLVTAALVAFVLLLFLRSARQFALLAAILVMATTCAFGLAAVTVGHLNAATAFLGAIIAGNGVNYGILLLTRFHEERGKHASTNLAMARALAATLRPTLVASLGAAVAYGSLAATSFQGFADFAVIGSLGMLVCWIASYTVLPALVLRFATGTDHKPSAELVGRALARMFGFRRRTWVLAIATVALAATGVVTYRYLADDPFEYNMANLRSAGADATEARTWMARSDAAFGRGITGQTIIAADSLDEVRQVVATLGATEHPGQPPTIGAIRSVLDVVPDAQPAKLRVLAELRTLIDALPDADREELRAVRPPDSLTAVTLENLPAPVLDSLRERDGRLGLLICVRPDAGLDEWNGKDLIRFADAVRRLDLGDGHTITTSGTSVIFSDLITTIRDDGPRVTAIAVLGLILMVVIVVGFNRRAVAVLVAVGAGALGLVATCALLDLRVNFLDFVALPITLGLGVDYAINVAERQAETHDVQLTLRTAGAAVLVCSLTTIIGYGSLMVSENLAIRGFGLASLIGEVTCLASALILVPAIVARPAQ
ncbi:hypothetical protein BH11MYX3_BH11MYX3_23340 [soil metagenome]